MIDALPIGAHVKLEDPLATADAVGAGAVQLFLSDPQGWKKPTARDDADALRAAPFPVFVHAPYLVNLAAANPRVRHPSRQILQQTLAAAADIGASGVVVHGGHVTDADDLVEGIVRWRKALEQLDTHGVPVLLENTAGGDHALARWFDTIAILWEAIGDLGVGFCLDTCHAHAAGENMTGVAERILAITGRIDLVHCNDSRDEFGSGRDRHEHLGQGHIDPDDLVSAVRTAGAPVICETALDGVAEDITFLREQLAVSG